MGIYDREYYREDGGGFWAVLSSHRVTWSLIIVTAAVWLGQLVTNGQGEPPWADPLGEWFGFDQRAVLHGQVWRLVTCHFVHTPFSLIAVGLGMLGLYWFGTSVEDIYGPREFLAFYLACGLVIGLGEVFVGLARQNPEHIYFGARGVLLGVFVLYACHFPNARVLLLVIPMPAWVLVAVIVGINLLGSFREPSGPTPILLAIGFAYLYYRAQVKISPPVVAVIDRVAGVFGHRPARRPEVRLADEPETDEPVPAAAPAPRSARPTRTVDEQLEAKLDHVLEKVARSGRESLTPEEREILLRASEIYKRRRGQ